MFLPPTYHVSWTYCSEQRYFRDGEWWVSINMALIVPGASGPVSPAEALTGGLLALRNAKGHSSKQAIQRTG